MSVIVIIRKKMAQSIVYVGNINRQLEESHLYALFKSFGSIVRIHFYKGKTEGKGVNPNYCFIEFGSREESTKALVEMANKLIMGRNLVLKLVDKADPMFGANEGKTAVNLSISEKIRIVDEKVRQMEEIKAEEIKAGNSTTSRLGGLLNDTGKEHKKHKDAHDSHHHHGHHDKKSHRSRSPRPSRSKSPKRRHRSKSRSRSPRRSRSRSRERHHHRH